MADPPSAPFDPPNASFDPPSAPFDPPSAPFDPPSAPCDPAPFDPPSAPFDATKVASGTGGIIVNGVGGMWYVGGKKGCWNSDETGGKKGCWNSGEASGRCMDDGLAKDPGGVSSACEPEQQSNFTPSSVGQQFPSWPPSPVHFGFIEHFA